MISTETPGPFDLIGEEARQESLASTLSLCMSGMLLVRIRTVGDFLEVNGHRVSHETINGFIARNWVFRVASGTKRGMQLTEQGREVLRFYKTTSLPQTDRPNSCV